MLNFATLKLALFVNFPMVLIPKSVFIQEPLAIPKLRDLA